HRSPRCARGWGPRSDRKSTRLNSSHVEKSYAVFCLKKKMPPAGARYREASRLFHQIFHRFTSPELVEGVALDEAYLDGNARTRHGTSTAEEVARRIKFQVHSEVGLFLSVRPPPPRSTLFPYTTLFRSHRSPRCARGWGPR